MALNNGRGLDIVILRFLNFCLGIIPANGYPSAALPVIVVLHAFFRTIEIKAGVGMGKDSLLSFLKLLYQY